MQTYLVKRVFGKDNVNGGARFTVRTHIHVVVLIQVISDRRGPSMWVTTPAGGDHQSLTFPWNVNVDLG